MRQLENFFLVLIPSEKRVNVILKRILVFFAVLVCIRCVYSKCGLKFISGSFQTWQQQVQ